MCHNYNGKIRMKEARKEEGRLIIATSSDDLFKLGIEIDLNNNNLLFCRKSTNQRGIKIYTVNTHKNILIGYRASCFTVYSMNSLSLRRESREGTIYVF